MFHKYHLLNQLQVFMRYKKLPKMSFNIPLSLLNLDNQYIINPLYLSVHAILNFSIFSITFRFGKI
jgi:hypothetical protein